MAHAWGPSAGGQRRADDEFQANKWPYLERKIVVTLFQVAHRFHMCTNTQTSLREVRNMGLEEESGESVTSREGLLIKFSRHL